MIYTIEEQEKRTAKLYAERDFLKEELNNTKNEAKKERIKEKIKQIENEAEELFFTPTIEDLEETKYWI